MNQNVLKKLEEILDKDRLLTEEPMKNHITFKVGGNADIFVLPKVSEVAEVLKICKDFTEPVTIVGNGSNLLVGDKGIRGVVVNIGKNMRNIEVEGDTLRVEAGATLAAAAMAAARAGLSGLEFASGIPGTFGGAVVMNAGAYGGEIKDILASVSVLDKEGQVRQLLAEELDLSYRHSNIPEQGYVVLSGVLKLEKKDPNLIEAYMEELRARRIEKQPLEYPSAGSTFKRPEGYFAGKLIMDAGLSGFSVGDAAVSTKHCGFVINKGNATAADVCELIDKIIQIVEEKYQVTLEPEVKKIGEF
ncbi:MAG: UDP-N-acetylmuramate dehydrogenase [Lachnospiraceae bacterium]|nr:UDP-N-acetylmuramate dehydrogenase [Lachnospiraceae bacterium]